MRSILSSRSPALVVSAVLAAGCGQGTLGSSSTTTSTGAGGANTSSAGGAGSSVSVTGGSTSTGASCMGTIGTQCGGVLGLDPNTLYSCNDGMPSVASVCKSTCIHNPNGDDVCPCPAGDGSYCGSAVGLDANILYDCKTGKLTPSATCGSGCAPSGGPMDKCKPCQFGDGLYCGQVVNQSAKDLYTCQGGKLTIQQHCPSDCVQKPPGQNDICGPCPVGNGVYCGFEIGADPNTLYDCQNGVLTPKMQCPSTCHQAPNGVNDFCNGTGKLNCSNVQWWNSGITYGPYQIHNGAYTWWDTDLAIGNNTPIELRHDSLLVADPIEPWGWEPQFIDQQTGQRFQFLHLHPQTRYTTAVNTVYPAGTVVGLSGGGTADTGYGTYSTGPHLCVETINPWLTCFPKGNDACQ